MNKMFHIRPSTESDMGFIFSNWMNAIYYGNKWNIDSVKTPQAPAEILSTIPYAEFFGDHGYKVIIQKIFERANIKIDVACFPEDHDTVVGFAIYEPKILHFVFTKTGWRKMGVAKGLVPPDTEWVTHLTKLGYFTKPNEWKYNPFLLMENTCPTNSTTRLKIIKNPATSLDKLCM